MRNNRWVGFRTLCNLLVRYDALFASSHRPQLSHPWAIAAHWTWERCHVAVGSTLGNRCVWATNSNISREYWEYRNNLHVSPVFTHHDQRHTLQPIWNDDVGTIQLWTTIVCGTSLVEGGYSVWMDVLIVQELACSICLYTIRITFIITFDEPSCLACRTVTAQLPVVGRLATSVMWLQQCIDISSSKTSAKLHRMCGVTTYCWVTPRHQPKSFCICNSGHLKSWCQRSSHASEHQKDLMGCRQTGIIASCL